MKHPRGIILRDEAFGIGNCSTVLSITALFLMLAASLLGCGVVYQVGNRVRVDQMEKSLQAGQSSLAIQKRWGQPDIIKNVGADSQIWSYAVRPNSNDLTATLFYTAPKEGDTGKFLDLNFASGKLVSWENATHTMPAKRFGGLNFVTPAGNVGPGAEYGIGPGGVGHF